MQRRLLLSIVAVSIAALAILGVPLAVLLSRLAHQEAHARLERQAQSLLLAVEAQLQAGRTVSVNDLLELVPEGDHLLVTVPDGRSADLGSPIEGESLSASAVGPSGLQVQLTTSAQPVTDRVRRAVLVLVGFGAGGVAAAALLGSVLARRLAAPLDDLAAVAARLGDGDFSVPAPRSGLAEVDAIAAALDRSSERISELVRAERAFSANASHQLSIHSAVVNVATIAGALALHRRIGAYGFAAGYVLGSWLHLGIAYAAAKPHLLAHGPTRSGRSRPIDLWTLLSGPGPILGQALAMEVNTAVSRAYSSTFGLGMTAAFDYGFKVFRVPLALLVIPLSQSLLPEISSLEASPNRRRNASRAMQHAAIITLAASAAMMVVIMLLRGDLVTLLFERGEFSEASTAAVATILLGYMPVILGRGMVDLLSRTLFSLGEYEAPLFRRGRGLGGQRRSVRGPA